MALLTVVRHIYVNIMITGKAALVNSDWLRSGLRLRLFWLNIWLCIAKPHSAIFSNHIKLWKLFSTNIKCGTCSVLILNLGTEKKRLRLLQSIAMLTHFYIIVQAWIAEGRGLQPCGPESIWEPGERLRGLGKYGIGLRWLAGEKGDPITWDQLGSRPAPLSS